MTGGTHQARAIRRQSFRAWVAQCPCGWWSDGARSGEFWDKADAEKAALVHHQDKNPA